MYQTGFFFPSAIPIKNRKITAPFCLVFAIVLFVHTGCKNPEDPYNWIPLKVTISAYNSHPSQTVGHPNVAAWGDTLVPGMKSIAVSRDLIPKGLRHNTMVKIEGLEGVYLVKDKMHSRWRNRIDIYMGNDIKKAKKWGKKKRMIRYAVPKAEKPTNKTST